MKHCYNCRSTGLVETEYENEYQCNNCKKIFYLCPNPECNSHSFSTIKGDKLKIVCDECKETQILRCPKCSSPNIIRHGKRNGVQKYRCKDKGHIFYKVFPTRQNKNWSKRLALCLLLQGFSHNEIRKITRKANTQSIENIKKKYFTEEVDNIIYDSSIKRNVPLESIEQLITEAYNESSANMIVIVERQDETTICILDDHTIAKKDNYIQVRVKSLGIFHRICNSFWMVKVTIKAQ